VVLKEKDDHIMPIWFSSSSSSSTTTSGSKNENNNEYYYYDRKGVVSSDENKFRWKFHFTKQGGNRPIHINW
jgi:hypothetical protein